MIKWSGWLIVLAGVVHSLGSLIETVPDHAGTWAGGALWRETGYTGLSDAAVGFWYSVNSFGLPLLLIGVLVLWMDRRGVMPPSFVAWAIAAWTIVTFVINGPSPLPILLIAVGLLLTGSRRVRRRERDSRDAELSAGGSTSAPVIATDTR